MAEGGLADKGFWALIVLGITTLLAFLRRPQETRRTRRRAQEAVQVASVIFRPIVGQDFAV